MSQNGQPQGFTITKEELQSLMTSVVQAAIAETKKLNPMEQKEYDAAVEADKNRAKLVYQLGKIEEEAMNYKKGRCSHTADSRTGDAKPKGAYGANWTTSGQVHGNDTITLVCLRCGTTWIFNATPAERDYAQNAEHGLLGFAPPPDDRIIKDEVAAVA